MERVAAVSIALTLSVSALASITPGPAMAHWMSMSVGWSSPWVFDEGREIQAG